MDDATLESHLRACGKGWFVEYYLQLSDWSIPHQNLAEKVLREKGYAKSSGSSRVSTGRAIIKLIAGSNASDTATIRARQLLGSVA